MNDELISDYLMVNVYSKCVNSYKESLIHQT